MWATLKYIFLIDDLCEKAQLSVCGSMSGLVVLGL